MKLNCKNDRLWIYYCCLFSNKKSAINALKIVRKILKIIGVFYQKLYKAFFVIYHKQFWGVEGSRAAFWYRHS